VAVVVIMSTGEFLSVCFTNIPHLQSVNT